MTIKLDNLPLGTVIETSQGRICIHYLADEFLRAYDKLGREDSPSARLRAFLPKIASQVPSERPALDDPAVTDQMANSMDDSDLVRVAEICLKDVLREKAWKRNQKLSPPPDRTDNEPSVSYFDRVVEAGRKSRQAAREADEKRFRDQIGTAFGGTFAGVVREAQELQSMLDQVGKSRAFADARSASPAHLARNPMEDIWAQQRRDRAEELELARTTADLAKQSTQVLTTSTLAQAQFFVDFRNAAEKSDKSTKIGIWFAALSLFATLVLSSFSLWYSQRSFEQDRLNNLGADKWQADVLKGLKRNSDDEQSAQKLQQEIVELRARLQALERQQPAVNSSRK